jgi:hypothetical protein
MQLGPAGLSLRVARSPVEVWPAGADHRCVGGTHTRVADGRLLCWSPEDLPAAASCAVDAEIATQPVPPALRRRSGIADPATFWRLWTRAEVRAKVRDVPIVVWLRAVDWAGDEDLPGVPPADVATTTVDDLIVSFGVGARSPTS